jgi:mono/diheme cytochrome c family protein
VVQHREPAELVVGGVMTIPLAMTSVSNDGLALFHGATGSALACASCHPEGGEDGRVWEFTTEGRRRTQSLRGGLLSTAPFHWRGELADMTALTEEVVVHRMGGEELEPARVASLAQWMDTIPVIPSSRVADDASERGRVLFNDPSVGCATCHSGPQFTNNSTVVVGYQNFGAMQVPSLRDVWARAPYMHAGCAATLRDRFTNLLCGGGDMHGHTSQLAPTQIDDLVAYLQTL